MDIELCRSGAKGCLQTKTSFNLKHLLF